MNAEGTSSAKNGVSAGLYFPERLSKIPTRARSPGRHFLTRGRSRLAKGCKNIWELMMWT